MVYLGVRFLSSTGIVVPPRGLRNTLWTTGWSEQTDGAGEAPGDARLRAVIRQDAEERKSADAEEARGGICFWSYLSLGLPRWITVPAEGIRQNKENFMSSDWRVLVNDVNA